MKILQVTPRYPPQSGGVETHVKEISERFVEHGHEVTVVTADAGHQGERRERRNGVTVRRYRSVAPNGAMHFCPQITVAVRRADADIVHAHNYHSFPMFFAAAGVGDRRFVVTTHYHGESASSVRDRLLSLYRPFGRWAVRRADEIIAVSEWEQEQLNSDFDVDATVIPNGVDVERFENANPVERERPYLLTVGRLEKYKGVQHVIRAMSELLGYDLLVAGNGPYRGELEQIAREEGAENRVEFLGYVDEVELPDLYAGADVYITMSEFEAYGITVAEALAARTPCVVRKLGALSDWVSYPGVVCVSSTSPMKLREAIDLAWKTDISSVTLPTWKERPTTWRGSTVSDVHVALMTPWDRRGGIAMYSERFAAELESLDIETTIVEIKNTDATNPLAFVSLLDDVPSDAELIHVQYEAGLFGKLRLSGVGAPAFFYSLAQVDVPVIVTLHEVHAEHVHRGPLGDGLLRLRDTIIERLALRAADATVVHTIQAKEVLKSRHGDGWRIEQMFHPTDSESEQMPISEAKSDLGVSGPVALTFGFVEEKKRYEDVIRVLPEIPNLTYLIAGGVRKGETRAVLKRVQELAEDLNVAERIEYLGYVNKNEVRVIFSAADVVVLPYERVSQSGVVNDALAYRRPVIASSLPAFEELRTEYGCLLTYKTLPELMTHLNQILSNSHQRDTLKQNSENYVQNVSWGSVFKTNKQALRLSANLSLKSLDIIIKMDNIAVSTLWLIILLSAPPPTSAVNGVDTQWVYTASR